MTAFEHLTQMNEHMTSKFNSKWHMTDDEKSKIRMKVLGDDLLDNVKEKAGKKGNRA